jgi:hypothetical protein
MTVDPYTIIARLPDLVVALSSWRGLNRVEIRDGNIVVMVKPEALPELIAALRKAYAEAVTRELVKPRDRTNTERQRRHRARLKAAPHG